MAHQTNTHEGMNYGTYGAETRNTFSGTCGSCGREMELTVEQRGRPPYDWFRCGGYECRTVTRLHLEKVESLDDE